MVYYIFTVYNRENGDIQKRRDRKREEWGKRNKNRIEVFGNDGEQTMTAWIYTPQSADGITFAADGKATVTVEQFELNL